MTTPAEPEVMIESGVFVTMRLPVAPEDHAALGEYIELKSRDAGVGCRALLTKGQWDRMRLAYPQNQDWFARGKIVVVGG